MVLGPQELASDSQTVILDHPEERIPFSPSMHRPGLRRRRRSIFFALGGLFLAAFLLTKLMAYVGSMSGSTGTGSAANPPAVPDLSEPAHPEPRLAALRRALDAEGYNTVHFRVDGGSMLLWGTVDSEADRVMVQTLVFTVGGVFSLDDRIQVRNTFAEP